MSFDFLKTLSVLAIALGSIQPIVAIIKTLSSGEKQYVTGAKAVLTYIFAGIAYFIMAIMNLTR